MSGGVPRQVEHGVLRDELPAGKYGHRIHIWDLHRRRRLQALKFGSEHQMVLELRPAHDPTKAYGLVNSVVSLKDLSSAIWLWYRANGEWKIQKIIEISAEPA